jgi:hypothetical protein
LSAEGGQAQSIGLSSKSSRFIISASAEGGQAQLIKLFPRKAIVSNNLQINSLSNQHISKSTSAFGGQAPIIRQNCFI